MPTLAIALITVVGLASLPSVSSEAMTSPSVYFGVFNGGSMTSLDGVKSFEAQAGKGVAIVNWFTSWGATTGKNRFQTEYLDNIRAHGSIPLVTWEPWATGRGVNQRRYQLRRIIDGRHDAYIRAWARDARAWGHPFFLRFAHEMNGDWYPWSETVNGNRPGEYVDAWRHVHDIFTEEGVENVTWVWCVNKLYAGSSEIPPLYPGDGYVDWTCLDAYNRGDAPGVDGNQFGGSDWLDFPDLVKPTYDELLTLASGKPIMIAEMGTVEQGGSKAEWFTKALKYELKENFPRVKAIVFFNIDKIYDNRISSSDSARTAFAEGIGLSYYASNTYAQASQSPIAPLVSDEDPSDTMGPFVNIAEPSKGVVRAGDRIATRIDALDRSGVVRIDVYVNGELVGTERHVPYECYWTVPDADSSYTIVAEAFDAAGNVARSEVSVRSLPANEPRRDHLEPRSEG